MPYWSPYFPNIVANVPTDNPWLLSQMTYNQQPNKGPASSLDQIFQEAQQYLGQGGLAPAGQQKPGNLPAAEQLPIPDTGSMGNNADAPAGPAGVSGALTGRGQTALSALSALTSPFSPSPVSPFSAISAIGQFAPQTTVNPSFAPAGQTLGQMGFSPSAFGVQTGPNAISVYGDTPNPSFMSSLMSTIAGAMGLSPSALSPEQSQSLFSALNNGMLGNIQTLDINTPIGLGQQSGPQFAYSGAPGGYTGAAPGSYSGPSGAGFGLDASNPSVTAGVAANAAQSQAAMAALASLFSGAFGRGVDDPGQAPTGPTGPAGPGPSSAPTGEAGPGGAAAGAGTGPGTSGEGSGASGPGGDAAWHKGGKIPGKGEKKILAKGGEFVVNKNSSEMFKPYIEAMNDLGNDNRPLTDLIKKAMKHVSGD